MNEQSNKPKLSKGKLIGYAVLGLFILGIITMMFADTEPSENAQNSQPTQVNEVATDTEEAIDEVAEVAFDIHSSEDISYAGCSRQAFTLVVTDDAEQDAVDATMRNLLDEYMQKYDDVTLWVYSSVEGAEDSLVTPDLGIYEDTRCE